MEGFFYSSVKDIQSKYWKSFLNRGFLFNENYFTTMISLDGHLVFEEHHRHRLQKTLDFMKAKNSSDKVSEIFNVCHHDMYEVMGLLDDLYIRINLYRSLEGDIEYFIWSEKKSPDCSELTLKTIPYYPNRNYPPFIKKADYDIAFHKRSSAKSEGFDDVLLLDENDKVLDLATSNIVFFKEETCIYSPLIPGVFDGICFAVYLDFLRQGTTPMECREITKNEISSFDCAIALNSFSGPRAICKIDDVEYNLVKADTLIDEFYKHIGFRWKERK